MSMDIQYEPHVIESLLEHVRAGETVAHAAEEVGVPFGTAQTWVRRYGQNAKTLRRRRRPVKIS